MQREPKGLSLLINVTDSPIMIQEATVNNSGDILSDISRHDGHRIILSEVIFVLDTYISPLICVIGFLGNLANLGVLSRSRFRKTDGQSESGAHIGLIYLAVSDMMLCMAMFPRAFIPSIHSLFDSYNFLLLYQAYSTGVITSLILISTWITVNMTFLRYFYICHPFRSRTWNSRRCALIVYPVSCLVCCIINIPSFFEYSIMDYSDGEITQYMLDIGRLGNSPGFKRAFEWCRIILSVCIPSIVLMFCNICLIRALRRSHRVRLQSFVKDTNAQRSRKWITLALILISVGFIIFVFPCELMMFFSDFIQLNVRRTEAFLLARSMVNSMQVANFALNFALYCVINVHFRLTIVDVCRCVSQKTGANSQPSSVISAGSMYSSRRVRYTQTRM